MQNEEGCSVEGRVERVVFTGSDDAWVVVRVRAEVSPELPWGTFSAVGHIPGVQEGQRLRFYGQWVEDNKYGRQFQVQRYSVAVPATSEGMEKYLASGIVPGLGPKLAKRIVEHFGERTLDVIREHPEQLELVEGIGKRKADDIRAAWVEQHGLQEAMVGLVSLKIQPATAAKIIKLYGERSLAMVRDNPYRLANEVRGIGFKTADEIAFNVGIARDSLERAQAGVAYCLEQATEEGHLYLERGALVDKGAALLGVPAEVAEQAVVELARSGRVVVEPGYDGLGVYLLSYWRTECALAKGLRRLAELPVKILESEVGRVTKHAEDALAVELAHEQREAVRAVLAERLVVVTGGPGTGKTTVVRAMCQALRTQGLRIALAAPTGRAAKRLAEATGLRASTVHRLLTYDPRTKTFQRDGDNPLESDAVIVDEASMLDVDLALALVQATPISARLVLVGDVDQLPSVGPGAVLQQLIESGAAHVIRLQFVFRQGEGSLIVDNAHRILAGEMPLDVEAELEPDYFRIANADSTAMLDIIRRVITRRAPQAFRVDPIEDVQVITPMRRGDLGAQNLNLKLQQWLNPNGRPMRRGDRELREGDKVMQTRNNYEKEVFNGDLGRVARVEPDDGVLHVRFDDRTLMYESAELDEIELAYAVTVHKSQGSEYPVIVVPLHMQHYMMLRRNLIYTALTRARKLAVLVAEDRALRMAVEQNEATQRCSRLRERLRGEMPC